MCNENAKITTVTTHRVDIEQDRLEPWAVVPFFKLVRELALQHGMPDIEGVECTVRVTFSGVDDAQPEAFKQKLDELWIVGFVKHEIFTFKDGQLLRDPEGRSDHG